MNFFDAASRIDVVAHAAPAEWWQITAALTPFAALLALMFVAVILAYANRRQNHPLLSLESDDSANLSRGAGLDLRAEWWSRAEWAMDMALDDRPERRKVGTAVLDQLSTDRFAGPEDAEIVAHARALLNRR